MFGWDTLIPIEYCYYHNYFNFYQHFYMASITYTQEQQQKDQQRQCHYPVLIRQRLVLISQTGIDFHIKLSLCLRIEAMSRELPITLLPCNWPCTVCKYFAITMRPIRPYQYLPQVPDLGSWSEEPNTGWFPPAIKVLSVALHRKSPQKSVRISLPAGTKNL